MCLAKEQSPLTFTLPTLTPNLPVPCAVDIARSQPANFHTPPSMAQQEIYKQPFRFVLGYFIRLSHLILRTSSMVRAITGFSGVWGRGGRNCHT